MPPITFYWEFPSNNLLYELNLGFGKGVLKVAYLSCSSFTFLIMSRIFVLFHIGDVVTSYKFTEWLKESSL